MRDEFTKEIQNREAFLLVDDAEYAGLGSFQ